MVRLFRPEWLDSCGFVLAGNALYTSVCFKRVIDIK